MRGPGWTSPLSRSLLALACGLALAVTALLTVPAEASAEPFKTVGGDDQVPNAVSALTEAGILRGRDASLLVPQEYVTRAQLAVYLARALDLEDSTTAVFTDVVGPETYFGAVGAMYEAGLVTGTTPTTFSPDELLSREQAVAWILRSLGFEVSRQQVAIIMVRSMGLEVAQDPDLTLLFRLSYLESTDAWLGGFQDRALIDPGNAWAVANGYRLGIIDPTADGWFYPKLPLSWGDMAVMLNRAFVQPLEIRTAYPAALAAQSVYPPQSSGSEGPLVWYIEYRLRSLMYRPGDIDGVYDHRTRDAVMAFQKVERLHRDGIAGGTFWEHIFTAQIPAAKLTGEDTRVEVDLTRQVLLMITDNEVWKIVHVSTGWGSGTPTGRGKVGTKQTGWNHCPVGWMYYVSYVMPHIAIHGMSSVPPKPASHGCIRVPIWMAVELFYELPTGTFVDIYYNP
jgi:N-acetylmuramoyl-L-alanine amidase